MSKVSKEDEGGEEGEEVTTITEGGGEEEETQILSQSLSPLLVQTQSLHLHQALLQVTTRIG